MDNIKKIKRTTQLASVLGKYGFETVITQTDIKKFIPKTFKMKDGKVKDVFSMSIFERIRMAMEELGPTYIKLGQLLSTRDDLLPKELTDELKKLQDDVPPEDIDIKQRLLEELNIVVDDVFDEFDCKPIAAASLSQVYVAYLKDVHKKVIVKVKKQGIQEVVESDLLIIKDFAQILEKYYDIARNIGIVNIVNAFENSILSELSLVHEISNIERFRYNFKDNNQIYVPLTYSNLSNNSILTMEFVDGIKISDKSILIDNHLDPEKVATTVVDLYMKQVFDNGFFHADPHSGNIFVLRDGRIAFIDYGSVGKLLPSDKDCLADFVIFAVKKDTKRLIRIIKKAAIRYNIPNEAQMERDLYELLDMVTNTPIKELDLKEVTSRFSSLLNRNRTILPDYMYLLMRGIVLLEGIGREICPDLNILKCIEPYGIKMAKQKISPDYLFKKGINKAYDISDLIEEIPSDLHSLIQKLNNDNMHVTHNINGLDDIKDTINRLVVAIIILALAVGSGMLVLADMPPILWGVPILGFLGFLFAGVLSFILIILVVRNKKHKKQ